MVFFGLRSVMLPLLIHLLLGFALLTEQQFSGNPDAANAMKELIRHNVGQNIAIVIGDEVVSTHTIRESITGGKVKISREAGEWNPRIYCSIGWDSRMSSLALVIRLQRQAPFLASWLRLIDVPAWCDWARCRQTRSDLVIQSETKSQDCLHPPAFLFQG